MENGSYSGMLGQLQRGEGHLMINYLTITHQRTKDFEYSVSYFKEGWVFDPPTTWHVPLRHDAQASTNIQYMYPHVYPHIHVLSF